MDNIKKVGVFIMLFVTLLIGMSLFGTLADSIYDATNLQQAANETLDFTTAFGINTTTAANDDIISVAAISNVTTDLTAQLDTNINWTKAGVFTIDGVTVVNATYNVTYNFEGDEYVAHATSRVLVRLINIFFALTILALAVWAMYAMGITELFKGN